MHHPIMRQTTSISCLAACLITVLQRRGYEANPLEEMAFLTAGTTFTRDDYTTGHAVHACKKHRAIIDQYVEYPAFYRLLATLPLPDNLRLQQQKITKRFLKDATHPIIIYIDSFYVNSTFHAPHYVVLERINEETVTLCDPWDGKRKTVPTQRLLRSVQSLRNNLKVSPVAILVHKNPTPRLRPRAGVNERGETTR